MAKKMTAAEKMRLAEARRKLRDGPPELADAPKPGREEVVDRAAKEAKAKFARRVVVGPGGRVSTIDW